MVRISGYTLRKKAFISLFVISLFFFFHEELSWPEESRANTEIKKIMVLVSDCNLRMPEDLQYRIAREICRTAAKDANLDIPLLCALINHESAKTWDPKVVSPAGAVGLMQVLPSTARGVLISHFSEKEERTHFSESLLCQVLSDPIINIRIGSAFLSSFIERHGLPQGLVAYYLGESRMKNLYRKSNGAVPAEARKYLSSIFESYLEMSQRICS